MVHVHVVLIALSRHPGWSLLLAVSVYELNRIVLAVSCLGFSVGSGFPRAPLVVS